MPVNNNYLDVKSETVLKHVKPGTVLKHIRGGVIQVKEITTYYVCYYNLLDFHLSMISIDLFKYNWSHDQCKSIDGHYHNELPCYDCKCFCQQSCKNSQEPWVCY